MLTTSLRAWLTRYWVRLALILGVLLLIAAPLLAVRMEWSPFLLLVYLQTPAYMIHQVEEHTGDRFRAFVNGQVYGGVDALTPAAVLVANLPGVWGVTVVSLCLALFAAPGWGLIGLYLIAVNGFVHIAGLVVWRRYNPGLWTAILLFVPLSAVTFWKSAAVQASGAQHAAGLVTALAIHGALVVHIRRRAARLRLEPV